jgi:hypothetical protein
MKKYIKNINSVKIIAHWDVMPFSLEEYIVAYRSIAK